MTTICEEAGKLESIDAQTRALAEFALTQFQGSRFERAGTRFVVRPQNFVTLSVHHKRGNHVVVSLRGNRKEFEIREELPLKRGRAPSWSEFRLEKPSQLEAAANYIKRAASLYQRGRNRVRTAPKTSE